MCIASNYGPYSQNLFELLVSTELDMWVSECILKAQVSGVSMRPPLCADADDLLRCSATVGNLGERGEPDILT